MPEKPSKTNHPADRSYFFDKGLRFTCIECGECCTGASGTIYMNEDEARAIADHLDQAFEDFIAKYAYPHLNGYSLKEQKNGDCVMFRDNRCSIYKVRPTQCRTYPFWPQNMRSETSWKKTCRECPGIGRGRLHSREEILQTLQRVLDECEDL